MNWILTWPWSVSWKVKVEQKWLWSKLLYLITCKLSFLNVPMILLIVLSLRMKHLPSLNPWLNLPFSECFANDTEPKPLNGPLFGFLPSPGWNEMLLIIPQTIKMIWKIYLVQIIESSAIYITRHNFDQFFTVDFVSRLRRECVWIAIEFWIWHFSYEFLQPLFAGEDFTIAHNK